MANIISNNSNNLNIRCLIVDDEENAIEGIIDCLNQIDSFQVVDTCFSAIEAMEVLKQKEIDLMFLDINMPRLTGIEFIESLQIPPIVILTTAYSDYALDAFRLNVADYLLKPYTFQRFFQATQKAIDLFNSKLPTRKNENTETKDVFIRQGDSFQKIDCKKILFVEAMQNYLKINLINNTFIIHQTMTSLEEMLPKDLFFRIHNSYLVNVNYIDSVSKSRLFVNGNELPISKYRKEKFLESIVYKKLISK